LTEHLARSRSSQAISGNRLSVSYLSQVCHRISFELKEPATKLNKTLFITSIDIDAGSRVLGYVNKGKNDTAVNKYLSESAVGQIEEIALPLLVDLFDNLSIPATFAIRGQLIEIDKAKIDCLLDSTIRHDIGAHGYFHKQFPTLSSKEAEFEIGKTTELLNEIGIHPKTFIFPANKAAYLDILENHGYKCFRDEGYFRNDSMKIEKHGNLYDIYPSMSLGYSTNLSLAKRIIDVAIAKKGPLHFWFHLWNFGITEHSLARNLSGLLGSLLSYAKEKERLGLLSFETMASAVDKIGRRTRVTYS
jgi:hypothetical protein